MKESVSEGNLTIIAIILITTVVVIMTPLVGALLKRQAWRACCNDQGGVVHGSSCTIYDNDHVAFEKTKEELIDENNHCVETYSRNDNDHGPGPDSE